MSENAQARVWRDAAAAAAACAYVHVHLVYARDVHEGAVYENAVHSFARARAYILARHRGAGGGSWREDARVCQPARPYVWVLTFHDLSRSFQRASKRPESAQIDKRNNRRREIEGLDLIRGERKRERERERERDRGRRARMPRGRENAVDESGKTPMG